LFINTGCVASMKSTEFSLPLVVDRIVTFLSGILGMNVENLGVCLFIYVKGKKYYVPRLKKAIFEEGKGFFSFCLLCYLLSVLKLAVMSPQTIMVFCYVVTNTPSYDFPPDPEENPPRSMCS